MTKIRPAWSRVELPLRTPRLVLRLPSAHDVPALSRAGSYREIARGSLVPYPFTRVRARTMVQRVREEFRLNRGLRLVILDNSSGDLIGFVGLAGVNLRDRQAEIHYWLTPPAWGQGFATEATEALLRAAFGPLALHHVTAHVLTFNTASERVLRRLGFRREGRQRETRFDGGRWHDSLVFGILDREFRANRRQKDA